MQTRTKSLLLPWLMVSAGCGSGGVESSFTHADTVRSTLSAPATAAQSPLSNIHNVFIIMLENHNWSDIVASKGAGYINQTLVSQSAHTLNYYGNAHPSEPNYIWLVSGQDFNIGNDDPPAANMQETTQNLATLFNQAGISWRSYQEDIVGTQCPLYDIGAYHTKHNPFVFFTNLTGQSDPNNADCIAHNRPLNELDGDLSTHTVARFNFITPNQCHDMHDGCAPMFDPIVQGDAWLSEMVPKILASDAYKQDGALFITWDESHVTDSCPDDNCPIGMLVLSSHAKAGYASTTRFDHSSTLRTFQEIFQVQPFLGAAQSSNDLAELFSP